MPGKRTQTKPRKRTKPISTIEENFRLRLPEARKARSMSQAHLAARLTELGYPMHETAIARIESGAR
jgi:ribosome-binding protein aMBF1 (putative translation factor)